MLARVAESLYWIGRNVERSEHCTRYMKVQYFSTLDAPMSQNKDFTLRSILFMSGSDFNVESVVKEKEVWAKVIFDTDNPNSLFRLSQNARENARSIRNNISSELWGAINGWFLYNKNLQGNKFSSSDIFSYTENNSIHFAFIKSTLANTLLHNDIYSFINLGMFVERSLQIIRILRSKISDSTILSNNGANITLMHYQWTTLLKSIEAFDVYKQFYKGIMSKKTIFEFIIENNLFPRSLIYSMNKIQSHLCRISVRPENFQTVLANLEQCIQDCVNFTNFSNEEDVIHFVGKTDECVSDFHSQVQNLYFQ